MAKLRWRLTQWVEQDESSTDLEAASLSEAWQIALPLLQPGAWTAEVRFNG